MLAMVAVLGGLADLLLVAGTQREVLVLADMVVMVVMVVVKALAVLLPPQLMVLMAVAEVAL
jgi:hypothetical protein